MESISELVFAFKAFVALGGAVYAFLGQPILILNEFRRDPTIRYRGIWVIATLILGPFATLPFGMFFSQRKGIRVASYIGCAAALFVGILYVKFGPGLGIAPNPGEPV